MGLEPVEARHHYDGTLVQPAHVGGLGRIAATLALSDVAAHLPAKAKDDDIQSLFIELHYTADGDDDPAMGTTALIDDFTDYQPPAQ
ncbi:hypothetical protein [Corynebacterium argentoratense]|uniref:hypothetical protein n=1 Tax=Corynebacterium argentoratense TaxID=42817 RepID=UPI0011829E6A|nr:hypothetical protein [Corynebacterium argentoratense]